MTQCATCGATIRDYQTCFGFDSFGDDLFCCEECAESYLEDHMDDVKEKLGLWEDQKDAEDPYERYGVSRNDF